MIEESLIVQKRTVDQGGYRVVKRVTVRQEEVNELLQFRTVHVERCAIDRLLLSMEVPANRQEGDALIIPVAEEVLVLETVDAQRKDRHHTDRFDDSLDAAGELAQRRSFTRANQSWLRAEG